MEKVRDRLVCVYRSVFTRPPYNEGEEAVEAFGDKLPRHCVREGFRLLVAWERGAVPGFAYGFTSGENGWACSLIEPLLSERESEAWLTDCFEFVELAVSPEARGRGFGGRLHDELLSDVPRRSAALFVSEEAEPASNLYQGRGWQTLIEGFRLPEVEHSVSVMGLDLGSTRPLCGGRSSL